MKSDRIILGEGNNCIFSTNTEKTQLNNNVIICGSSGSGKNMSVTEMRLLETFNSSLVVNLSKRKLVAKYTPLFKFCLRKLPMY
jgi:ABC-type polar amino acid transport system ATPase subunit